MPTPTAPSPRRRPTRQPGGSRAHTYVQRISVTIGRRRRLLPYMNIHSKCLYHVAAGVAMRGLNRPVPATATVLRRAPDPARLLTIVVALIVISACSDTDPAVEPEQPSNPDSTAALGEPDNGDEAEPAPEDDAPDAEELAAVWEAFHTAWIEQATVDEPDPTAFEAVAADPDSVIETLIAQRAESRLVTTEAELWSQFDIDGDNAEVTDCAIVVQHPDGQPDSVATITVGWEANAVMTDKGWRIQDARQLDLFCIAEELNAQLLDAYQAFRDAKDAAWDPPDPDHPSLERTMKGEQLEFIRDLLTEHHREGIVIREPASTKNAVVFDVGIGTATVSDCTEQVEGYGAFDLETGERLNDLIAPVEPGRLDAQSVDLERQTDGRWKVVDQAASRGTDCVKGSTRYAVQ